MKLTEIVKILFVRNGQHLSGDLSRIKLSLDKFWATIEQDILDFQEYYPYVQEFNIQSAAYGQGGGRYLFEFDSHNLGQDLGADPSEPGNAPDDIIKCLPIGTTQMIVNWISYMGTGTYPGQLGTVANGRTFLKKYRNKILYTTEPGKFDITALYKYFFIKTETTEGLKEVEILGIDGQDNKVLFDILSGRFLTVVGRSRRAFTYQDLPIITDADQLVKEGEELYQKGIEQMYERHPWYQGVKR